MKTENYSDLELESSWLTIPNGDCNMMAVVAKRKLPYEEGDWIAVPLPKGGWAAGIIARSPRKGKILFGYFFPKKFEDVPNLDAVSDLTSSEAVLIRQFGDLGLIQGRWKVIGRSPTWERKAWPMTPFVYYDLLNGRPYQREYSDDGENQFIAEHRCDEAAAKSLPEDGISGAQALEIRLGMVLHQEGPQKP